MNYPVISFNAGELSPQIDARSDVDKYKSGCRRLENMIPKIYGSAERRPGTKYIDTVNGAGRVVSFIYSNSIAYILLLEDYAMYFYYNGARVLDSLGRRLKVDTPYAVGDLPALQFKQSNDVCWIVHPNYPPHKLSRVSANSFSLDAITFTNGPFKKRNDLEVGDGITLTPSVTTGSGTLTAAGGNVFQAGHVGALFRVVQPRAVTSTSGSRTTTGVIGAAILTEGDCTLNIEQGWAGTVRLERSIDAGVSWEVRRSYTSKDKFRAVQFTFTEEEDNIQHRINVTVATSGTFAADLTVNSSTQEGICRVTGVTGQVANMTVLKNFASTGADTRWSEGSWSAVRGYPTTVTFFEDRCIYAGNPHQPQTVWFSATGDYENMDEGTIDDSAFWLTMSSDHRNAILWISALEALIIGTSAGEWRIRSSDYDEPITPTNFSMKEQTTYGSKAIQALPVNDVILFVDSVGRKIREVAYVGDKDKYNAPDLTALAEHITETGIVAIAHQKNPDSILWAVRADGTLLSMTYEREQDVVAWARHLIAPSPVDESYINWESGGYSSLRCSAAYTPVSTPAGDTLVSPTSVTSASDLQAMTGSGHYTIDADIDLSGVTWIPIADFTGVVEGNNHTISNLDVDGGTGVNSQKIGLFANLGTNAEVRNLRFFNCTVRGETCLGILVGQVNGNYVLVKNVVVQNSQIIVPTLVWYLQARAGLVVGYVTGFGCDFYDSTVIDSTITTTGTGVYFKRVGGFVGEEVGSGSTAFVRCKVEGGSITNAHAVGGFVGYSNTGLYSNCSSSMNLLVDDVQGYEIGGFVGLGGGSFYNCYASGNITISDNASGYGTLSVGGFAGYFSNATFSNCYASGNITISTNTYIIEVGGFIGSYYWFGSSVPYFWCCDSRGTITINNEGTVGAIGGFAGRIWASTVATRGWLKVCWSTSDIIVANSSRIYSPSTYRKGIGGFIGTLSHYGFQCANCYARGSITDLSGTSYYIGGFIGYVDTLSVANTVSNCYATGGDSGTITPGSMYVGGFVGGDPSDSLTATNCFWDMETSGLIISADGIGKTTSEMFRDDLYIDAGWDTTTVWRTTPSELLTYSAVTSIYSVAVIPSTNEDEIWLIVGRTINGAQMQMLEQMQPRNFGDPEDAWFVDCGLFYNGAPEDTFLGLEHLEGEEVVILGDGAVFPRQVVADGQIVLPNTVSKCIIGLPFRYVLKPMRFDILTQHGTTKGSLKKISEVVISFFETSLAKYGIDENNLFEIDWRTDEAYGEPPALFTGDVVVVHEGGFSVEDSIVISGDDPTPCTIRAIIPRIEITGR